jgi:hypothetical protein
MLCQDERTFGGIEQKHKVLPVICNYNAPTSWRFRHSDLFKGISDLNFQPIRIYERGPHLRQSVSDCCISHATAYRAIWDYVVIFRYCQLDFVLQVQQFLIFRAVWYRLVRDHMIVDDHSKRGQDAPPTRCDSSKTIEFRLDRRQSGSNATLKLSKATADPSLRSG